MTKEKASKRIPTKKKQKETIWKIECVRSGIRTHAYKSRLRPERSALDRSAILTTYLNEKFVEYKNVIKDSFVYFWSAVC